MVLTVVDTDPELDTPVLRHLGVPLGHPALDIYSAPQRIHHAGELHEHAVASGLDDPAAMEGDGRVNQLAPKLAEALERAFLIQPVSREYPATSAARIAASLRGAFMASPHMYADQALFLGSPPTGAHSDVRRALSYGVLPRIEAGWPGSFSGDPTGTSLSSANR